MAYSNWSWIAARNPGAYASEGRLEYERREARKRKPVAQSRFSRKYGSFWDRRQAGKVRRISATVVNGEKLDKPTGAYWDAKECKWVACV